MPMVYLKEEINQSHWKNVQSLLGPIKNGDFWNAVPKHWLVWDLNCTFLFW